MLTPRVDRSALISRHYEVFLPRVVHWPQGPGLTYGRRSEVFDGRTLIATHPRPWRRGRQCVQLDHYLEVLRIKARRPAWFHRLGAGAQLPGRSPPAHDAFWAAARKPTATLPATRELIDVLLLHRS